MALTGAPILHQFSPQKPIILQTDESGFANPPFLNAYNGYVILGPVNFYSRKCSPAEQNYDSHDLEFFAIVETKKQWRHYLEGANHKLLIPRNNKNLEYIQYSKVLSQGQARWVEILSSYNSVIEHLEGKQNPADEPSRRPDSEMLYERPTARLLATLAATHIEWYNDLFLAINTDKAINALAADVKPRTVGTPIVKIHDL